MKEKQYAVVGYGTPEERKVEMTEFLQVDFEDGRTVHVCKTELDGVMVSVLNSKESGRTPYQSIWLSDDSLTSMIDTICLYFIGKGIKLDDMIGKRFESIIGMNHSDNIKIEPPLK